MIDVNTYSKLSRAKETLQDRLGVKLSYGDLFIDLMSRRIDLLSTDISVKKLIQEFARLSVGSGFVTGILVFGSVAKGTFEKSSDIDILITVKGNKSAALEAILSITKTLESDRELLMKEGLPSLISPVILSEEDMNTFRPFYFDLADYGIIMYEEGTILSDFLYRMKYKKHERFLIDNTEVLTW
jgi:predicted nucleotidyltransferase